MIFLFMHRSFEPENALRPDELICAITKVLDGVFLFRWEDQFVYEFVKVSKHFQHGILSWKKYYRLMLFKLKNQRRLLF